MAALFVPGQAASVAAQVEHQGLDLFVPALYDVFWSLVVIGVIALAFYKWILPPMMKVLDARTDSIEDGLAKADQAREAAEQAIAKRQETLDAARTEAAQVRDQARIAGKAIAAEQRALATAEANRIAEAAERQIEAERQAAAAALRSEVGGLAAELATRIVGEALVSDGAQSQVIDRFLDELAASQSHIELEADQGDKGLEVSHDAPR
ncbi:MAG: F0F1 ATP synthase subunit B [Promicromonosporaceae bacterium]|nr:F0F1 ATP synthase subunit B [Promicromonosporaceae bacterium]